MDTFVLILKVLLLSLGISIVIKYFMPVLAIAPTPINALLAVLLPSVIIGALLLRQLITNHL